MIQEPPRLCWTPGEERSHTVYQYTADIYKFVQWYSVRIRSGPGPKDQQKHHDHKLASSISRAKRVILEKALCNEWEWFCTFTISKDHFDRKNLETWRDSFTQWMRDQRKKGKKIRYLLVPEMHQDGSWHAHGFLSGLAESDLISFADMHKRGDKVPRKLWKSSYMNWEAYQQKFGFCSLGKIKNSTAAGFYVTKYITKENDRMVKAVGLHSYYASLGLNTAQKFVDFFGRDPLVDKLLVNKYDFCATGMTHLKDRVDWGMKAVELAEAAPYSDFRCFEPLDLKPQPDNEKSAPEIEADDFYEFEQLAFKLKM